jgi:hypothetical protein
MASFLAIISLCFGGYEEFELQKELIRRFYSAEKSDFAAITNKDSENQEKFKLDVNEELSKRTSYDYSYCNFYWTSCLSTFCSCCLDKKSH